MAPTRRSLNCWAANKFSTKSARSVPKSAPSVPKSRVRRWKRPRHRADRLPQRLRMWKKRSRVFSRQEFQEPEAAKKGVRRQSVTKHLAALLSNEKMPSRERGHFYGVYPG